MPTIQELQNRFTKEKYPPNDKNISDVPFEDVMDDLLMLFGEKGWAHTVTQVGQLGHDNYVVTKLVLYCDDATLVIPGAAQGPIGISGLINMALKNAYLRHAGAGTELYSHEPGQEPQFQNQAPQAPVGVPPNPFADQKWKQGNQWTPKKYNGFQKGPSGPQGAWTGMDLIKSGPYAGVAWKDVPLNGLQEMLQRNSANSRAIQELQRRGVAV